MNMKICRAAYGVYKYVALNVLYIFSCRIHQNFALCFGGNSRCAWLGAQLSCINFIWFWGEKKMCTCKSMQYRDTCMLSVKCGEFVYSSLRVADVWIDYKHHIFQYQYFCDYSFLFWKYEL